MHVFQDTIEREECLAMSIKDLARVNKQIARLNLHKEELTNQIIGALGHEHEGQKTYEYGVWKLEVKTPFVYSLNKKLYESGNVQLPIEYNPIKQSVSYTIDKRLCEQYLQEAPEYAREALIELIDKKPGRAGITIKERV